MANAVLMPALSPTMTEGKLAKWVKKEGDEVENGDVLAEIETDKATMEVEAVEEGILAKILVPEGTDNVSVNTTIAVIADEDEDEDAIEAAAKEGGGGGGEAAAEAEDAPAESADEEAPKEAPTPERAPAEAKPAPEPDYGETKEQTVREAIRDAIAEEMRRDEKVFIMGEEVAEYQGAYKVTQGILDEFGDRRVIDTPITEHGFTGLGVGAAFAKLRPIVEFMTWNFAMQGIDQIINSAAKTLYMSGGQMGCPIVFRGPNGAAARVGAQHSQCYAAWYAHCPGLSVLTPYSAADHKGLLKAAVRDPNPVIILENEILYGRTFEVPVDEDFVLPIGKAKVEREGADVTIVGYSISVEHALKAAEELAEDGIDAEVINLRSVRPIDVETIAASVRKTNRIVTVGEGWPTCGIGAEISTLMLEHCFDDLDAPPVRVSGVDVPMPYAANLEELALPRPHHVVAAAKKVCYAD